jgi:hypothetical protein
MRNTSDIQRLAETVANIATRITEIIELRIREAATGAKAAEAVHGGINMLTQAEGWVGKKEAAEHLKISVRSVRIGKSVRFKLSQIDAAMDRRSGVATRY